MKQTYQKMCFCMAVMLAFALNAVAGIERSESFCPSRTPEQPCTMNNVPVKHKYTLFSDGMPSSAVVVIQGTEFRSLNAQGDQSIEATDLEAKDVVVKVGGGYLAKVSIDNANYQVNVKFKPFFIPTASVDAEKSSAYLLRMPAAYVKKTGDNLLFTNARAEADKFIFIEKEQGQYYIYDQTAKGYIYYVSTDNGSSVKSTASSNVRFTTDATEANTWQLLYLSEETAAIVPGSVRNPSASSASLNFMGGIAGQNVLNLWHASDANSAWEIIDPTAGSMPCATLMYALPGAPLHPQARGQQRRDRRQCGLRKHLHPLAQERQSGNGQQVQVRGRYRSLGRRRVFLHGQPHHCRR